MTFMGKDTSITTRGCYVTYDYYDILNKENMLNSIPSNSPFTSYSQMENYPWDDESKVENCILRLQHIDLRHGQEKYMRKEKKLHIDVNASPSAFETYITPTSGWDSSSFGSSTSSIPTYNDVKAPPHISPASERYLMTDDKSECNFENLAGSDEYCFMEDEELVSILQSSMKRKTQQIFDIEKESLSFPSGRINPAIPTEDIFRKGYLRKS